MQINLSELFVCEGKVMQYEIPIEMDEFVTASGRYPLTEKKPLQLTITHSKNRNIKICGNLDLHMTIPCDRCLEPVDNHLQLTFEREVDANATEEQRGQIEAILPVKYQINENEIAAYRLSSSDECYCQPVINEKTGLVSKNELDSASDEIMRVFNSLYQYYAKTLAK